MKKKLTQKQKKLKKMIAPKIGASNDDDPEMLFELRCKHCGSLYYMAAGYDDKFCSEECSEAAKDE